MCVIFQIFQDYQTIEYHIHIWQVSPQLSCGATCQIWMWFNGYNLRRIRNIFIMEKLRSEILGTSTTWFSCKIDHFCFDFFQSFHGAGLSDDLSLISVIDYLDRGSWHTFRSARSLCCVSQRTDFWGFPKWTASCNGSPNEQHLVMVHQMNNIL